jgi:hypothetical protein
VKLEALKEAGGLKHEAWALKEAGGLKHEA